MARRKNRKAKPETAPEIVRTKSATAIAVALEEPAPVFAPPAPPVLRVPDPPAVKQRDRKATLDAASGRRALGGFFLSGLLFSFLGSFLPSWGYHVKSDYLTVGLYFLFLNFGIYVAFHLTQLLVPRRGVRFALALGSAIAMASLIYLSTVSGAVPPSYRMAGLFFVGVSAAMVNTAIFHAITPMYEHDPAATINLAGVFFGLGCLATSIVIAASFNTYNAASILLILACIPFFYFISWLRAGNVPISRAEFPSLKVAIKDFRSPGAVLFTLLLFFQFGNEWAIAGWLPLFVIQRLGASPATGIGLLACYWGALLVGRVVAQALLRRMKHSRLLLFSVLAAFFGCLLLSFTATVDGAFVAVVLLGAGFAAIYPLTAESIEHRFRNYHPGFYNGIFSLGLTGALLAPSALGFAAHYFGIATVMWLPLLGSIAVFVLVLAIWLEARLTKT